MSLATATELEELLEESIPAARATLLLELATGAIQAAAGQDLLADTSDIELMGTPEAWLTLPQSPVTAVDEVQIDGEVVSDWSWHGSRLWRASGWARSPHAPSRVEVSYSHGLEPGHPDLKFARMAVLMVAAQMAANPTGADSFGIDDYREQFSQSKDLLLNQVPKNLQRSLRRRYGRRGGLVKIG